ncbi:MAG TPA: phosphatase PAP2 family protein [Cryomorphaceae bacterium]|nr:phosphatase PAP2 family protein [Owenweeksia sp.]MBF97900.1 phosphatase PAP2 family protein [Owenweeksia sp.]HAD97223.1 phosphatase PAP2 family protein [Cryomorphaceae bacterium]HBF20044.1 phosphatase PAP2 family protein [Cryomorphaceae bacterium]HCQ15394.1 phosphatase PAP2 family protein [Cryomorphaceae bacterium]|tara:strand:- start:2273 stop:2830 length:558 start_codon:yes stop_codon:yes gene_type:complete
MDKLLEWDKELFLALNGLGKDFWDPFWLAVSGTVIWIPLYALLLFLLFRKLSLRNFLILLPLVVLNVFMTDQGSVMLFKEQFQRLRPCHVEELLQQMRLVKEGCGGQFGFISSHAANTFGLAVLVGNLLKPHHRYALILLLLWAVMVSFSRIYLGVHYPLDILAGGLYGALCGFIVLRIFQRIRR